MSTPIVTALIQARLTSTRLPGKTLLPLAGKPLLSHIIERIVAVPAVNRVVLAIPESPDNVPLADLAKKKGIDWFAGSEDDVLGRFHGAAEKFGGDLIVRVTADNPFTDTFFAGMAVEKALETGADICAPGGLPLGTAVEVISRTALDAAFEEGNLPHHREHVSPFIKEHPERFTIVRFDAGLGTKYGNLRLTVDTREDFLLAETLYRELYEGSPFPLSAVLEYLEEHPEIAGINRHVAQRPMTHSSTGEGADGR